MKISEIFDVFSKRNPKSEKKDLPPIPITFRRKVVMVCDDAFSSGLNSHFLLIWKEIHRALLLRHGQFGFHPNAESERDDAVAFLLSCKDDEFLDFIEYIFKVENFRLIFHNPNLLVDAFNRLFESDNIGYELTDFQTRAVDESGHFRSLTRVIEIVSYPIVICKDDLFVHNSIVKPAITLLSNKNFAPAQAEFLDALEDYRKQDYGDCVIKCCSAFESTMKIICKQKNWPYDPNKDTASRLVKIIIEKSGLDPSLQAQLEAIGTLRNRLSKAHGAGPDPRAVDKFIAQYAINISASAILFLVNEIM